MDEIILVDGADNEIGWIEKASGHRGSGLLHRAFSILIFDGDRMLLTRRSPGKATWPLRWSNACCSHPRRGESCLEAGTRRLREELGFSCDLQFLFKFQYAAIYDDRFAENELDWVFAGRYSGPIRLNPTEAVDHRFVAAGELRRELESDPERYTPWFRIIMNELPEYSGP